ncbi:hypothetical protein CNR27_00270 [Luteimonas chenhongjianii]|uniref:HTH cro/C1-type domain-containing protein n=1 Tax=Luteimonas chenhongjianii TaxID=2006110 RepID=A0A290XAA4_9GAMM|nr:hypothetical protein CNR27_00270 [Luteimonas chenhongjianii]
MPIIGAELGTKLLPDLATGVTRLHGQLPRAQNRPPEAGATGIHRATLSKIANQPGANIGTDIIDKLCKYFGCQPGDLLTYVEGSTGSV